MEEEGIKWIEGKFECIHALEGTQIETESCQVLARRGAAAGSGRWASGGVGVYTPPSWMLAAFVHRYLK